MELKLLFFHNEFEFLEMVTRNFFVLLSSHYEFKKNSAAKVPWWNKDMLPSSFCCLFIVEGSYHLEIALSMRRSADSKTTIALMANLKWICYWITIFMHEEHKVFPRWENSTVFLPWEVRFVAIVFMFNIHRLCLSKK